MYRWLLPALVSLALGAAACRDTALDDPPVVPIDIDLTGFWEGSAGWFRARMELIRQEDQVYGVGSVTVSPVSGRWSGADYGFGISSNGTLVGGNWFSPADTGIVSGSYHHPELRLSLSTLSSDGTRTPLTELTGTISDDAATITGRYTGGPASGRTAHLTFTGQRPTYPVRVRGRTEAGEIALEIEPDFVFVGIVAPDSTMAGTIASERLLPVDLRLVRRR